MTSAGSRPEVSFITAPSNVQPWGRIASWLVAGFEERGRRLDPVHLSIRARAAVPALVRYLRATRPSLAIVAPAQIAPFAIVAGRIAGVPVVPWEVTFLSLDLAERKRYLRALPALQRVTYGRAPCVAVVSRDVGDHCLERFPGLGEDDVFELPNPVDSSEVRAAAAGARPTGGGLRIVAAGRLADQKGFDLLIEAMSIAGPRLGAAWELRILGEGPRQGKLEDLARRRGLVGRIRMSGHSPNPFQEVAAADLFVHPARWEGFGMVLVEAMCLGIPIVATECPGGPREILGEGSAGLLVPPEDPAALAEAIERAAADPALRKRLSEEGLSRAENYAPARVADRLLALVDLLS